MQTLSTILIATQVECHACQAGPGTGGACPATTPFHPDHGEPRRLDEEEFAGFPRAGDGDVVTDLMQALSGWCKFGLTLSNLKELPIYPMVPSLAVLRSL
eukprot:745818-Hanusia_phi.AAC.2